MQELQIILQIKKKNVDVMSGSLSWQKFVKILSNSL